MNPFLHRRGGLSIPVSAPPLATGIYQRCIRQRHPTSRRNSHRSMKMERQKKLCWE